ncbi:hypothetical protein [Butyrivibrio sp. WCD3002]|uniref:hypothetical protein n=1 Tax=Butyrivibrio sp. WCD3002 TaxID=1280676 RepID=UPI0004290ABC|nr:hypothetical protein [Butyrivibrio sp. WCD3002]
MEEYKEYYIAFIDVLGFKNLIQNETCQKIIDIYKSIRSMRVLNERIEEGGEEKSVPLIPDEDINIKIMSDSVCIYIRADIPESLFELLFICMDFQNRMIELDPPILLRGAIAKGNLYSDDDIIFGPGFVKAYVMEEKNASVPRIIITKDIVDDYIKTFPEMRVSYNLLNRDYDAFYYIEYISAYGLTNRDKLGKYDELYKYIENVLNSTTDDSVRNKFLYLESKVLPLLKMENKN